MASRSILKNFFKTGLFPTEGQFAQFIDSVWNKTDDSIKISDVENLSNTLAGKVSTDQLNAKADVSYVDNKDEYLLTSINNEATARIATDALKADLVEGIVPTSQLPSFVDEILEVANYAALPPTGASAKIYITLDTNLQYRWSGSVYIQLVASPGSTDAVPEGASNKYFTNSRVLNCVIAGVSFVTNAAIDATDTILIALGKIQAQINAIFKIPTGGSTGQVLAKASSLDGNVHWIDAAGGGGVSGLTPKDILYGKNDGTIGQDDVLQFDQITKTLSIGVLNNVNIGLSLVAFGDSIVRGSTGLTDHEHSFTYLVANNLGLTEVNHGIDASTIVGFDTSSIPIKTLADKYLLIGYGVNDAHDDTITQANFNTAYTAFLDAAINKGWFGKEIIMISINGASLLYNNLSKAQSFNNTIYNLATAYGATYVDVFTPISDTINGGSNLLSNDNLHPNDLGAKITSYIVLNTINDPNFVFTNQRLAITGKTELVEVYIKNPELLSNGRLLVMDENGKIGCCLGLPVQNLKGEYILDGSIVQYGVNLPSDFDLTKDFAFLPGSKLVSNTPSLAKGGAIIPFTPTGNTEIRNYFHLGEIDFYVSGGTDGLEVLGASLSPFGIFKAKGFELPLGQSLGSNDFGTITPLDYGGTNGMNFKNLYSGGGFNWYVSEGIDHNAILHMRLDVSGRLQIGRNAVDIPGAKVAIDSTTEGFLKPRMTSTQRDSINNPPEGLEIYNITTHKNNFYNGTGWRECADIMAT